MESLLISNATLRKREEERYGNVLEMNSLSRCSASFLRDQLLITEREIESKFVQPPQRVAPAPEAKGRIAIFLANYSIDNSPSILNLLNLFVCEYELDLFLWNVSVKDRLKQYGDSIRVFNDSSVDELRTHVRESEYASILTIDPHGFCYAKKLFPHCKPIYYSLELYIKNDHFGLDYPDDVMRFERENISSISCLVIQSKEKAEAFRRDYGLSENIPDFILPVTYEGKGSSAKSDYLRTKYGIAAEKKIALHLGGIAPYFSCLEIIQQFAKLNDWVLVFQGYPDRQYLNTLQHYIRSNQITNVVFSDELFNSFEDTYKILASSDVGIAWYNDISPGFRMAGYSSGKISAYLKFGLPVIAKKYQATMDRIQNTHVGVCIDEVAQLPNAIKKIQKKYATFSSNALTEFDRLYSFDNYRDGLKQLLAPQATAPAIANLAAQEYWDSGYESYQFVRTPDDDPIRLWLEEHLPVGNGSCLEIGAFPGRFLSIFGELGYEVNGVDLHGGIVDRLPAWFKSLGFKVGEFRKADFTAAPFSRQFDVVCSFGFIEHFDRWEIVVEKMLMLVKPGGLLVLETPNFAGALQRYLHSELDIENLKRHNLHSMNPELWAALTREHGFEILTSGYFGGFDFWVDNQQRSAQQENMLRQVNDILPFLKRMNVNDKSFSPYCGLIARKKRTNEQKPASQTQTMAVQHREFEVNNWEISDFVVKKLVPIVSVHPFPLNELMLLVGSVVQIKPTHIFEWGTNIGVSARVFYETIKHFNMPCEIHTIDLPDDVSHVEHPGNHRGKYVRGIDTVQMHQGDGIGKTIELIRGITSPKRLLIFVDGDHSRESVARELSMIEESVESPNIILHDTFYQSPESDYNTGPHQAIKEYLATTRNEYKVVTVNTGLPGMTLLYCVGKKTSSTQTSKTETGKVKKSSPTKPIAKFNFGEKPLHILNTVEFYAPHVGGAEAVVQKLSERFVQRGHRVTVATTKLAERTFSELNGVEVRGFDVSGNLVRGFQGSGVNDYVAELSDSKYGVMFNYAAQQWATDLAFNVLASTRSKRVNVLAPCGYSALKDSKTLQWQPYASYFNDVLPRVLPMYDALVHHSALYKDYQYAKDRQLPNSLVIPNGADEKEFEQPNAINFRKKFGITARHIGLCVANFYAGKGQDRLIETVRQLNRPDFELVLIGKEGDELDRLRKLAADLPVRFLVNIPREDTLAAFRSANVFLFGSHVEAFPLVILEAKASALPFISTDCGNVKELRGGIICDAKEFATVVRTLLDEESYRKALGAEGKKEWKERFTWSAVIDQYERLFYALAESKRGRN